MKIAYIFSDRINVDLIFLLILLNAIQMMELMVQS